MRALGWNQNKLLKLVSIYARLAYRFHINNEF